MTKDHRDQSEEWVTRCSLHGKWFPVSCTTDCCMVDVHLLSTLLFACVPSQGKSVLTSQTSSCKQQPCGRLQWQLQVWDLHIVVKIAFYFLRVTQLLKLLPI